MSITERPTDVAYRATGDPTAPDLHPNGVNHLAISTADMKLQLTFFAEVLGCPTKALYWMHGVPNTFHGFVQLADDSYIAFVQAPGNPDRAGVGGHPLGQLRRPGHGGHDAARRAERRLDRRGAGDARPHPQSRHPGARPARPRHDPVDLLRRPREPEPRGVHRHVRSTSGSGSTPRCRRLCGIDADEMQRLIAPAGFDRPDNAVAQPDRDESLPSMHYPPGVIDKIMGLPDDVAWANLSVTDPPVPLD